MSCPHPEKQAHRSFSAALKARDSLEGERGIDLGLRPYRCVCGSWHLGHRPRKALGSGRNKFTRRRAR